MREMKKLPIGRKVNFLIVSDHGMENVVYKNTIYLDNYIQKNWCQEFFGHTPMLLIEPMKGYSDSILAKLSAVKHLKIWNKEEIPQRLHFGSNPRVNHLVILADSSYSIGWKVEKLNVRGNHGYDNQNSDMHGIFYASDRF